MEAENPKGKDFQIQLCRIDPCHISEFIGGHVVYLVGHNLRYLVVIWKLFFFSIL